MSKDNLLNDDTIAAISTPPGEGGIAVLRISGPESLSILKKIFKPGGDKDKSHFETHKMFYGSIIDPETDNRIDNVMSVYFQSPKSYTGEDTVEIYSHGGNIVPNSILKLLIKAGARPADPGEFTKRAFLNGKIDLTQAEAVANIIHAQTDTGLRYAEKQLEGKVSEKINILKEQILDILADIEAHVDFPEEGIEESVKDNILHSCKNILTELDTLIKTYERGKIFKDGVNTAILGKPNVGKSSLLNQLLNMERAIVSPVAGTTRDFIEEVIDLNGIPLKVIDTAGIRATTDEIEKLGVDLSDKKAQEAEFIIIVIDGSSTPDNDDLEVLNRRDNKKCVIVLNKSDLGINLSEEFLKQIPGELPVAEISALNGEGIEELRTLIYNTIIESENNTESSETVLTDLRHKHSLQSCKKHITSFIKLLKREESPEFLALDLRVTLDSLGEITGEVTTEELLGKIFSKFCIGK